MLKPCLIYGKLEIKPIHTISYLKIVAILLGIVLGPSPAGRSSIDLRNLLSSFSFLTTNNILSDFDISSYFLDGTYKMYHELQL